MFTHTLKGDQTPTNLDSKEQHIEHIESINHAARETEAEAEGEGETEAAQP